MKKDWKRHIAYEVLVILVMLTVLMFLCRLWPIIFLLIIGIFITALRLLFLSPKRVEVVEPLPLPALPEPKEPTEQDVRDIAYSVILRRITELVTASYPTARQAVPRALICGWHLHNAMIHPGIMRLP